MRHEIPIQNDFHFFIIFIMDEFFIPYDDPQKPELLCNNLVTIPYSSHWTADRS